MFHTTTDDECKRRARPRLGATLVFAALLLPVLLMLTRRAEARGPVKPHGKPAASADSGDDDDDDDDDDESPPAKPAPSSKSKNKSKKTTASAASTSTSASATTETKPHGTKQAKPEEDDEDAPTVGAETDLVSRFVFRGVGVSDGPALQPSVWATGWGFTASVFANVLLNDEPPLHRVSHLVPALEWSHKWGPLTVVPGVVHYRSSSVEGPATTTELSLEVGFSLGSGFRLLSTNHVDVGTTAGAYYTTLGAEYEREKGSWTIKAALDVAYANRKFNDEYFGVSSAAIDLAEAKLAAQHDLTDVFYFVLHSELAVLLAPSIRSSGSGASLMSGGVALGFEL